MRAEGVADAAIGAFAHYYQQLREGETGCCPRPTSSRCRPARPRRPDRRRHREPRHAIVIELNGGLGTSMGMTRAKSLIEAKDGLTFLDIVVGQVLALRERYGARVPLVLMNSFATREDSLAALERIREMAPTCRRTSCRTRSRRSRRRPAAGRRGRHDPALEWARPATATSTPRS